MLFEASLNSEAMPSGVMSSRKPKKAKSPLGIGPVGRGRFNNAEQTIWQGEDLDIPTFIRRNVNLDF
jgi:hypothetical protein